MAKTALKKTDYEEADEETDCQVLVVGCLGCRMTFGAQRLRQLPHKLVFFKAAFV